MASYPLSKGACAYTPIGYPNTPRVLMTIYEIRLTWYRNYVVNPQAPITLVVHISLVEAFTKRSGCSLPRCPFSLMLILLYTRRSPWVHRRRHTTSTRRTNGLPFWGNFALKIRSLKSWLLLQVLDKFSRDRPSGAAANS